VVKGFREGEVAKASLAAGSDVVTDGLSCWPAVARAGCRHWPMPTGSGRQAASWAPFTWVNTALRQHQDPRFPGTHHYVSASFAWRFNSRYCTDAFRGFSLARICSGVFVQVNGLGSALCSAM
jgi:hypothetical protein